MTREEEIRQAIRTAPENAVFTEKGWEPIFSAPKTSRILIIGQAPGIKTQEAGVCFLDPSGDNLRSWLGVDKTCFYESGLFAILPMDFYFPGHGKSGDLPPRKDFASKWHPQLLEVMPQIELTIVIGAYAQEKYLHSPYKTVTETVKHFEEFLPSHMPLVHPSPRNNIWQAKNPWFQKEVIPILQQRVRILLEKYG